MGRDNCRHREVANPGLEVRSCGNATLLNPPEQSHRKANILFSLLCYNIMPLLCYMVKHLFCIPSIVVWRRTSIARPERKWKDT
jgi:hypothetical protein